MHVVKVLQGFQEEWSGKEEGWRENADVTSRLKLSVFRLAAKRAQELSRSSRFSPQEKREIRSVIVGRAPAGPKGKYHRVLPIWNNLVVFVMCPLTLEIPTALFTSQSPD